jgi:hypothetical protein
MSVFLKTNEKIKYFVTLFRNLSENVFVIFFTKLCLVIYRNINHFCFEVDIDTGQPCKSFTKRTLHREPDILTSAEIITLLEKWTS